MKTNIAFVLAGILLVATAFASAQSSLSLTGGRVEACPCGFFDVPVQVENTGPLEEKVLLKLSTEEGLSFFEPPELTVKPYSTGLTTLEGQVACDAKPGQKLFTIENNGAGKLAGIYVPACDSLTLEHVSTVPGCGTAEYAFKLVNNGRVMQAGTISSTLSQAYSTLSSQAFAIAPGDEFAFGITLKAMPGDERKTFTVTAKGETATATTDGILLVSNCPAPTPYPTIRPTATPAPATASPTPEPSGNVLLTPFAFLGSLLNSAWNVVSPQAMATPVPTPQKYATPTPQATAPKPSTPPSSSSPTPQKYATPTPTPAGQQPESGITGLIAAGVSSPFFWVPVLLALLVLGVLLFIDSRQEKEETKFDREGMVGYLDDVTAEDKQKTTTETSKAGAATKTTTETKETKSTKTITTTSTTKPASTAPTKAAAMTTTPTSKTPAFQEGDDRAARLKRIKDAIGGN